MLRQLTFFICGIIIYGICFFFRCQSKLIMCCSSCKKRYTEAVSVQIQVWAWWVHLLMYLTLIFMRYFLSWNFGCCSHYSAIFHICAVSLPVCADSNRLELVLCYAKWRSFYSELYRESLRTPPYSTFNCLQSFAPTYGVFWLMGLVMETPCKNRDDHWLSDMFSLCYLDLYSLHSYLCSLNMKGFNFYFFLFFFLFGHARVNITKNRENEWVGT